MSCLFRFATRLCMVSEWVLALRATQEGSEYCELVVIFTSTDGRQTPIAVGYWSNRSLLRLWGLKKLLERTAFLQSWAFLIGILNHRLTRQQGASPAVMICPGANTQRCLVAEVSIFR